MAIEVMKRYENKYLVNGYTYLKLHDRISEFTELDEFNKESDFYTISNLYYDTDDNNLIRTSISKPKYKEKLRIRAYGIPALTDRVFLEIKKKYKGLVNKRRTELELQEAYDFVSTRGVIHKNYMNKQVLDELTYFIQIYNPQPKLYLAYDRRAYFGEHDLRITFDTNIRSRRYDLGLEKGEHGEKLLDDELWLIEIKAFGAMPLWLTRLLSEYKVYRQNISKYGVEYQKFLMKEREEKPCLNQLPTQLVEPLLSHRKVFSLQWQ